MRVLSAGVLSCAFLTFALTGCGGGRDPALPDLAPVSGTVTMDGEPASGVAVTFWPAGSSRGGMCFANTDEGGRYELKDAHGDKGAQEGDFQVTCSKWVTADGSPFTSDTESPMEAGAQQLISARYSDEAITELKATVPAGGGTFDFEVT